MGDTNHAFSTERVPIDLRPKIAQFSVRADRSTPVVDMAGEIDLSNAEEVAACLSIFDPGDTVIVDMSNLTYLNPHGAAALAGTCTRGVKVICRNAQRPVRRVLDLCGFGGVLTIED